MTRFSICIGASNPPYVTSIPAAKNDAIAMHRLLLARGFRGVLLTDMQATRHRFRLELARLAKYADADDSAVLYMSGHAGPRPDAGALPGDEPANPLRSDEAFAFFDGLLLDDELPELIRALPAIHLTVIIDACHAAGFDDMIRHRRPDEASGPRSLRLFAATSEPDLSRADEQHSHYTKHLLTLLTDPKAPSDPSEINLRLKNALESENHGQNPQTRGTHDRAPDFGELPAQLPEQDIQLHVLRGFRRTHQGLLFFRIDDPNLFKSSLTEVAALLTPSLGHHSGTLRALGFSFRGLKALNAPNLDYFTRSPAEPSGTFNSASNLGPYSDIRLARLSGTNRNAFPVDCVGRSRAILGDPHKGEGAVSEWKVGGEDIRRRPDGVLIIGAHTETELRQELESTSRQLQGALFIHEDIAETLENQTEHFGFVDNITSTGIAAQSSTKALCIPRRATAVYDPGKLLLFPSPAVPAANWQANGSFLVYRRLSQDVAAFRAALTSNGKQDTNMAARIVGRWPDGSPYELYPSRPVGEPRSDFDYHARRCPAASHIRKVQPRKHPWAQVDSQPIFRRSVPFGRPFDDDESSERGLLFMCYQSSIERQFEAIVSKWCNDADMPREDTGVDALTGRNYSNVKSGARRSTSVSPKPLLSFVHATGGGYFFVPTLSAIRSLAESE